MTPPAASAAARRAPAQRAAPAPRPQRRVSGPVAVPRRRRQRTLGERALLWVRALPDHRLLHRLIGGRIWIVLVGTLLVGLVTLQLSMLKLNAGIGRAVEHSSLLEQRNAVLRASISDLSDSARIVSAATQMGFVTPLQGTPRYRPVKASDARAALSVMRVPAPVAPDPVVMTAVATDPSATSVPSTDPTAAAGTTSDVTSTTATTTTTTTTAPVTTTTPPVTSDSGAATSGTTTPSSASTTTTAMAGGATAPTQG